MESITPPSDAAFVRLLEAVKYDRDGLVAVVAQDADTGVVRMVAWANQAALQATRATGQATFWSRSRQSLWRKGAESGNVMPVQEIRIDCDGDTLLYLCNAHGPSCHTGKTSCFHRTPSTPTLATDDGPPAPPAAILGRLTKVIATRRGQPAEKSYVASLLAKGFGKIGEKITEEAREVTEALPTGDKEHIAHEAADVMFHLLVGLEAAGVEVDDVFNELGRRFGVGGHVEKASRTGGGPSTSSP